MIGNSVAMLLAFFAVKEKDNVILEVKKSFKKIGRGFSGSGSRQLNPTHSSVSEFPLPGAGSSVNGQFAY